VKRKTMYIVMVLAAILVVGALAGCGQQKASSESASASAASSTSSAQVSSSASASSASASSGRAKDGAIAELESAAAKTPEFKSVTVTETTTWSYLDGTSTAPETVQATGVYKFDMSGDQLKESVSAEYEGQKLQYFTDGKTAVFVSDGPVYSGTVEQFGTEDYSGFDVFLAHVIGELGMIAGCTTAVDKTEADGSTNYLLTLDPEKYAASDEMLTALAASGAPITQALFTIGLDGNGNVTSMNLALSFGDSSIVENLAFSDFNSTVVDPAPEATIKYEEMEASMQQELKTLMGDLDAFRASPSEASSSAASASSGAAKTN